MKYFEHESAISFEDAVTKLKGSNTGENVVIAGGSDLIGVLKEKILGSYPKTVIDLKTIKNADYINMSGNTLEIGALTKLKDIVNSEEIKEKVPMLSEAAKSVATPLIRNVATIGGNICQDVRCWFYRYPHGVGGRMDCMRKGGKECYAVRGDNRYHSIYGGMKTHATPCSVGCPANTDIPAYMEKLRKSDIVGAAKIIMQANPMPMITSRVCAHFCQDHCNRISNDESVAVHSVERFIGDYILDNIDKFYKAPAKETGKKIAIIGAGPAGLSAAFYLRKAGHDITVIDKMDEAGGLLTYALPAYRMPKEHVKKLAAAYELMGVKFKLNTTIGKDIQASELETNYDKVFYATGAWKRPVLGFDGEEFTEFGLKFLVDIKNWVDKKQRDSVLVVGGGNVAMDVAITAKRLGAKSVTMACLESEPEMPASKEEIARAREEGIVIMPSYGISRALYENGKVTGMELIRCTSVRDENGKFNPQYDQNERLIIKSDSILMAAGQKVDLSFIEDKYELAVNRGLIKVDEDTQQTSRSGVYAGGDLTTGPSTVVQAIRAGRNAAESINSEYGIVKGIEETEGFISFDTEGVKKETAVKDKELSAAERAVDKEDSFTLGWSEVLEEIKRCMNCGCYSVNASDISPVLVALDADIVTTKKTIKAADFFTTKLEAVDMLDTDELVSSIKIDIPEGYKMSYDKFRVREAVDFAIVSMASLYRMEKGVVKDAKIVLGGVAPIPLRRTDVEKLIKGKKPSDSLADEAVALAVHDADAMKDNGYKVQEVRTLIKRFVQGMK